MKIVTTYLDDSIADAIEGACKKTSKSKSAVVGEALKQVFISKEAFDLIAERLELEELERSKKETELDMIDIERRINQKELHIEELRNSIAENWVKEEVNLLAVELDNPENVLDEFRAKINLISEPWLKEQVTNYMNNGGDSEVLKMAKRVKVETK